MTQYIKGLPENEIKYIFLRTLAWRLGDLADFPNKLMETFSVTQSESYVLLELLCPVLDIVINENPKSAEEIYKLINDQIDEATRMNLANAAFNSIEKCISFCKEHTPSLSRVLYHDWTTNIQIATESLGRIARPVASITMRIQPAASGKNILPPVKSVTMDLTKDMIDALASGFDRLQNQLVRIVQ